MNADPALLTTAEGRELGRILAGILDRLTRLEESQRSSQLERTSLHNGSLDVHDATGIRQRIGVQDDGAFTSIDVNGPPPPVPTAPIVTALPGGFTVRWDGGFAAGAARPTDWRRVDVHVDLTTGFTPTLATVDAGILVPDGATVHFTSADYVPHYVRFVAVNTSGTESAPTAQVAVTPLQLAEGDVAPGAVGSVQLADGAVEPQHLTAELVLATKVIAGDPLAGHIVLDGPANEWSVYRPDGVTRSLLAAGDTGDLLVTGELASGLTGQRIRILPAGTMRFYRPGGVSYAEITNLGNDLLFSGVLDVNGRTGALNLNELGVGLNFRNPSTTDLLAEHVLFQNRVRTTAPEVKFVVDQRYTPPSTPHRVEFSQLNSSGVVINNSLFQIRLGGGGEAYLYSPTFDIGFVYTGAAMFCSDAAGAARAVSASAFTVISDTRRKRNLRDPDFTGGPLGVIRRAPVRVWEYADDLPGRRPPRPGHRLERLDRANRVVAETEAEWGAPERPARPHIGPLIEDLPPALRAGTAELPEEDVRDLVGVLWGGVRQLDGRDDMLADRVAVVGEAVTALTIRVAALEAGP